MKFMKASLAFLLVACVLLSACAALAEADKPQKITFQYIGGTVPEADEAVKKAIAKYTADTGIEVETVYVNWGNAYQMFVSSMMAGNPADIVELGGVWPLEFVDKGAFAEIDQYVSADILNNFFDNGFDVVTGSDGKRYGMPWDGGTWGLYYRKDLFEEAGLDPEAPPKNWDELLEYAKKLTKEDGSQYGLMIPCGGWEPDSFFNQFMWQAGNEVCVKQEDGTYIGNFDTPEGLTATTFYYDLVNTHKVMPVEVTGMMWEAVKNAFTDGKAAMMYNGMWAVNNIRNTSPELDGKWATAYAPAGPGAQVCQGYPNSMHITAMSKNKEAAGKLLEYIYGSNGDEPSVYKQLMVMLGVHSWEKDFADTMDWAKDPLVLPLVEQAAWGHNKPAYVRYEQFRKMFYCPALQSLLMDQITPEQFVKDMDAAILKLQTF